MRSGTWSTKHISLLLALALGLQLPDGQDRIDTLGIGAFVQVHEQPINPPRRAMGASKSDPWEFEWRADGLSGTPVERRVSVFSQEDGPLRRLTARYLMRLWSIGRARWGLDHPLTDGRSRAIDVYLCWGGDAGGEQRIEEIIENGRAWRTNSIYIYDLASWRSPVEMAREIAHEYGHAVLPALGGFKQPEAWLNGRLGELLFLTLVHEHVRNQRIPTSDVFDAKESELNDWLSANARPLANNAASVGPNLTQIRKGDQQASDLASGLALELHRVLPPGLFLRSLQLAAGRDASSIVSAAVEACEGQSYLVTPHRPALWLPLGKASLRGGQVVKRANGWALVKGSAATIEVTPKP